MQTSDALAWYRDLTPEQRSAVDRLTRAEHARRGIRPMRLEPHTRWMAEYDARRRI